MSINAPSENLTSDALRAGLGSCVKVAQKATYASELRYLAKGKQIGRWSSLRKLSPFLDANGLLRVGGRLSHADITEDAKHPLILPHNHKLTKLVIADTHEARFHSRHNGLCTS